jgi:predicted nucleotidyltransferase
MFEEILAKVSNLLNKLAIPYMIIGGQAVLFHGEPRLTRDIDITLGISIEKSDLIIENLKEINLKPLPENARDFVNKTFVLPTEDINTRIRVDFIFSQTDYEKRAIARSIKIDLKGVKVNFTTVEDLLIHKIFAGRPKDLEDVKILILKNPGINKTYVRKWLTDFDKTLDKNFLKQFNDIIRKL